MSKVKKFCKNSGFMDSSSYNILNSSAYPPFQPDPTAFKMSPKPTSSPSSPSPMSLGLPLRRRRRLSLIQVLQEMDRKAKEAAKEAAAKREEQVKKDKDSKRNED